MLYIKDHFKERRLLTYRCIAALLLISFLTLGICARLVYLQIYKSHFYTTLSKKNRIEIVPLEPNRGLIYDRNHLLLAKNIPVFSLDIIPSQVKSIDKVIKQLKKILPISDTEIESFKKTLYQHRRFEEIPLKIKLSDKEVAIFSVNKYRIPGAVIKARLLREYPFSEADAHVVGYVGRINAQEVETISQENYSASNYIGKIGIEKYYEGTLHGQVGYKQIEVDASSNIIRTLGVKAPIPGNDITLTIDNHLQQVAQTALKGHPGAVVAIDPNNGQVLAISSIPSFDPNVFVKGISTKEYQALQGNPYHPLYNRTTRGLYPAGSTIKPFVALKALSEGIVTPEDKVYDPGYFELDNSKHIFHDWKQGGHGWVNIHKAIVVSCDTYFYWLALRMKIVNIDEVLNAFGFGSKTGIDLNNELSGLIPSPSWKQAIHGQDWYPGDTLNTIIGQGYLLTTPLQLASATATLSARGLRYQPSLLLSQHTAGDEEIVADAVELPPVYATQEAYDQLVIAMQDVIRDKEGTGFRFGRNTPYTVGVKTGTAQVSSKRGIRSEDLPEKLRDNGVFIAFAPAEHPKIAVAVIAEHTETVAPNIARKVIDAYLTPTAEEDSE
jgi:penicillin-binding protein 2